MSQYTVSVNNNEFLINTVVQDLNLSLSRTGGQGSSGNSVSDAYFDSNDNLIIEVSNAAGGVVQTINLGPVAAVNATSISETCKNVSGGTLAIGTPVYQSGTAGQAMEVQAARADTAASMPAVGVLTSTLADEAEGSLVLTGFVKGFDTSAFSEGDTLYIGATGGLTTTAPPGSGNLIQNIGKVIKVHASNGSIMVTGAGRANDTPNLDDGDIFIGNASNLATTASLETEVQTIGDARYVEVAGDTMTGDLSFGDNDKAIFGTGLQIYDSGTASYILGANTGLLVIEGSDLRLRAVDNTNYFRGVDGSATYLYHPDATNGIKLATTSTGVDVTGTITSDGLTVDGITVLDSETNFVADTSSANKSLVLASQGATGGNGALGASVAFSRINSESPRAAIAAINTDSSFERMGLSFWTHQDNFANVMKKRMVIDHRGDISFYEDTGTTAKFFWDASAESLGIGTSSPSAPLTLSGTGASSAFATFNSGNTADITSYSARAALELISYQSDGGSPYTKTSAIIANGDGTVPSEMQFWTKTNGQSSPAERMRLDSSGNVLVGKTGSNLFTVGAELTSTGQVYATASSAPTARFNRKTSDGEIVDFRKDDTTVGSIGTVDGDLNVFASASGHKGLRFGNGYIAPTSNSTSIQDATTDLGLSTHRFKDLYLSGLAYTNKVVTQTVFREGSDGSGLHFTTNAIYPTDQTSAVSNGTESLGAANYRFKDLYLGGGVYLGGTGSANKLSDYEEGTWTPTLHDNVGGSISLGTAYYTKVGRIVQVRINNYNNSNFSTLNASGALRISGFPFAGTGGAVPFGTNNPNNLNLLLDISGTSSWLWNGNGAVDFSFGNKGSIGLGTGAASMRGIVTYQAS